VTTLVIRDYTVRVHDVGNRNVTKSAPKSHSNVRGFQVPGTIGHPGQVTTDIAGNCFGSYLFCHYVNG